MTGCENPIKLEDKESKTIYTVGCGKCIICKIYRSSTWTNRLVDEAENWKKLSVIVLTYHDKYIAHSNNQVSVYYEDVKRYIARLRDNIFREAKKWENINRKNKGWPKMNKNEEKELREKHKIKYYCAEEYGGKTHRPHYHLVIYGLGRKDDEKIINRNWHYGAVLWDIKNRPVTKEAVQYVAGYVQKKLYDGKYNTHYLENNQLPPQNHMSQGIGIRTARKKRKDFTEKMLTYDGGNRTIPRAYIKAYKKDDEKTLEKIIKAHENKIINVKEREILIKHLWRNSIEKLLWEIAEERKEKWEEETYLKTGIITNPNNIKQIKNKGDIISTIFKAEEKNFSKELKEKKAYYKKYGYTEEIYNWQLKENKKNAEQAKEKSKNYRKSEAI